MGQHAQRSLVRKNMACEILKLKRIELGEETKDLRGMSLVRAIKHERAF